MRDRRWLAVAAVIGASVLASAAVAWAAPQSRPGPPASVSVVVVAPGAGCAGDQAVVSWTPPRRSGGSALTGYELIQEADVSDPPHITEYNLGPGVTSQAVTLDFLEDDFLVYAVNAEGASQTPATTTIETEKTPAAPVFFDGTGSETVGPRSATLVVGWSAEDGVFFAGGNLADDTITISPAPGGGPLIYTPSDFTQQVTVPHLTPGTAYTFSAVAANKCGTSAVGASELPLTPGVAPQWKHDTPPLWATTGVRYHSRFAAGGKPHATYALTGAPSWLSVDATTGVVSGSPPAATTSFTYAVVAHNGVGDPVFHPSDITAGPFTVAVS